MSAERLTEDQRAFLRSLALAAVTAAARGAPPPDPGSAATKAGVALTGALAERRGVFVTLRRHGSLRGCIGSIVGRRPLFAGVVESGGNAAVRDPRFPPLRPAEIPDLELEISALTPLAPVPGPEAIVPGRHGVLLEADGRSAVFLPQVAPEQGWDRETMLDHLALKAGLPADAWRRGASLQVFAAEVF